ncbi:MAG: beta-lactamase family protein [Rikenellaceae bacterium]|nr:beta-lactamase family protein [Rikenellaceae bacterium]
MKKFLLALSVMLCTTSNNYGIPYQLNTVENREHSRIDPEKINRVDSLITRYIEENKAVNAVVLLGKDGQIFYNRAYGWKNREADEILKETDIFRLASMTKSIVSVALMTLFEEGKFLLDDPLWWYIPEFKDMEVIAELNSDGTYTTRPAKRKITIRHLLCHSSGIPYDAVYNQSAGLSFQSTMGEESIGVLVRKFAGTPLAHDPGEKFTYGMNVEVIGYLIEVLSGKTLDVFLEERIFKPLGMEDTYFFLPEDKRDRLVTLYSWDKTDEMFKVSGDYVYQNFAVEGPQKCFLGGAGLCGTAMDYAKFCQMLLNKGEFNGKKILSPRTVQLMTEYNQLALNDKPSHDFMFGLGFKIHSRSDASRTLTSEGAYGWSGMFGTYYRIYPGENIFIIFMGNHYPWQYRDRIDELLQVAVFQALKE